MIKHNPLIKIIQGIEQLKQEQESKVDYDKVAEFIQKRNDIRIRKEKATD
ncbi:hypothetical protein V7201_02210 [Bacillus sp. JJ1122]